MKLGQYPNLALKDSSKWSRKLNACKAYAKLTCRVGEELAADGNVSRLC